MKKALSIVLTLAMLFLLCACGASTTTPPATTDPGTTTEAEPAPAADGTVYTLRLATQVAQPNPLANSAYRFAEKVAEATNGQVKIDVYPSNQLGDYTSVFEEMELGTIDLAWISADSSFDPMIDVQGIPYLFENWDQAREIWLNQEGFLFQTYKGAIEGYGAQNVTVMGVVPGGFLGICINTDKFDQETLFDTSVSKDLLIRHPNMVVARMIVEGLGFKSMALSWSELYNALQTGVVDGAYGAGAGTVYTDLRDVSKYFVDYRYLMEMMAMMASTSSLDKLPEDLRQIVIDTAVAEQYDAFDEYEAFEKAGYKDLEDYGITVIYPTDEQMATLAASMRDKVWPGLDDVFTPEVMAGIRAQVESLG